MEALPGWEGKTGFSPFSVGDFGGKIDSRGGAETRRILLK
jgi:hypothetical protein